MPRDSSARHTHSAHHNLIGRNMTRIEVDDVRLSAPGGYSPAQPEPVAVDVDVHAFDSTL